MVKIDYNNVNKAQAREDAIAEKRQLAKEKALELQLKQAQFLAEQLEAQDIRRRKGLVGVRY